MKLESSQILLWLLAAASSASGNEGGACAKKDNPSCNPVDAPIVEQAATDFTVVPLEELEFEQMTWRETGEVVTDYAFEMAVPDSLTNALLEYADRLGITQRFHELTVGGHPLNPGAQEFFNVGNEEEPMEWYIQRPDSFWNSNMHWISPADDASHDDFLKVLGDGGMDEMLNNLGESLGLDGLVCYQLTFIGVSKCEQGYIHHDFTGVEGGSFNVIIPLKLAKNSPPELLVLDSEPPYKKGGYKYRVGAASVIGDDAYHGTGEVDYDGEFRMAATIYIADVNEDNVDNILENYTQYFPPADPDHLLSIAGAHWGNGKLPRHPRSMKMPPGVAEQ